MVNEYLIIFFNGKILLISIKTLMEEKKNFKKYKILKNSFNGYSH